ncbi:zinc finger domain-containing protein [Streptomyces pseudogriseolus]|uniref:zinc finger domain-containing protein n=1 Tax=Streptomyces pseudogriseolus TaxID=36817 RepID=UPI003FA25956
MPQDPAFPPLHEYALAYRCPTCGAEPGTPCDAPRKKAKIDRHNDIREQVGQLPLKTNPLHLMHISRQDAGHRHYQRDLGKAPWPEDREPGRRYDTLDKLSGS